MFTSAARVTPALCKVIICVAILLSSMSSSPAISSSPAKVEYDTLSLLLTLDVKPEKSEGYMRSMFKHWSDLDRDGCTTRESVLRRDATSKFAPIKPKSSCKVTNGVWFSVYDGVYEYSSSSIDIDHVVSLSEAYRSGAYKWSTVMKQKFANDESDARSLRAVSKSSNRSKSDKDPALWLPSRAAYTCTYISDWVAIKARWSLSVDAKEYAKLRAMLTSTCQGLKTKGWITVKGVS